MFYWVVNSIFFLAGELSERSGRSRRQSESGSEYIEDRKVVCYYANWAVYRQGDAKFTPQNINPYLCTHLIYAFGGLGKDDTLVPFDEYQDIEKGKLWAEYRLDPSCSLTQLKISQVLGRQSCGEREQYLALN